MGEKSNTSWKYDFNPLGVKQMELISGGFSAEYGNAQSGVVKIVTREGTPQFHGEARIEYRPPGKYHFGDYLYSHSNFEWQKWGALLNWFGANAFRLPLSEQVGQPYQRDAIPLNLYYRVDSLGIFLPYSLTINDSLAAAYYNKWITTHTPGGDPVWLVNGYQWEYETRVANGSGDSLSLYRRDWHLARSLNPTNRLGVYDYRDLAYIRTLFGLGGPVGKYPGSTFYFSGERRLKPTRLPTYEQYTVYDNFNLTTVLRLSGDIKLRTMLQYQHNRGGIFSGSDDIRWASPVGNVSFHSGQQKYLLTTVPPKDETSWIQSFNLTWMFRPETFLESVLSHTYEQYLINSHPLSTLWQVTQGVWDEGYTRLVWDPSATLYNQDVRTRTWALKSDFVHQFSPRNHFKAGGQVTLWQMHYHSVSSAFANAFIAKSGFAEYYRAQPYYFAFYLQDKMEYNGLIANIGLRADGFNNHIDMPADVYNPFYQGKDANAIGDPATVRPRTHTALAPRFGLSFPIGELTAFRLQYGHFYAMPIFRHTLSRSTWQGWIMYGNPDLGFRKTISYEFGLQHSLFGTHRLDLVAYYNDRTRQTVNIRRHFDTGSVGRSVTDPYAATYVNTGYGATRGIEVALDKITSGDWRYRLKYSLARTSAGIYGASEIWAEDDPNRPFDMRNYIRRNNDNITSEDKTHAFSAIVSYLTDARSGWRMGGLYPLGNWLIALTYTARSGVPFTYVTDYDDFFDIDNNRRYPLEYQTDLNLSKTIARGSYAFSLSCRIQNLFNNRWLTPFDPYVEQDGLREWVETGMTWDNPHHLDPEYSRYNYFRVYRNIPREIFFSIGVAY